MSKQKNPIVAPQDRVPRLQKFMYGAGCMTGQFTTSITMQMFTPVFNIALGISPAIVGGILMLYRLWDSITDVIMGNISDNARTRWGRRRPFIIIGSVLAGLILPFIWLPTVDWSHGATIAYLIILGAILYTATTIWGMPYYSLGMELTPDYNERTRVTAVRAVFEKLTGLLGGWMLALASLQMFANPITGEPDIANGMRHVCWLLGLAAICSGILPGIFVKERYYKKDASKQKKVSLLKSLRLTLSCKPFMILMSVYLLKIAGSTLVNSLGLYLNIYYVNAGDIQQAGIIQGWKSTAMLIPGILSIPLWAWIAEKVGKRHALALTIAMGFIANILIYFCYTPNHPYLQIVPSVFLSAFGSAIWMLIPSMQADIADYDELNNGERREGSFSSISSWFFKLAMTLSTGAAGVILTMTGFDVIKYGKAQPPEVLTRMLEWYVFLPMGAWALALILLTRYQLSHSKIQNIRTELEQRRGII